MLKEIDGGPFNKEQAVRVYIWNKQGNDIPDMSKRDVNRLVDTLIIVTNIINISKGVFYDRKNKPQLQEQ